MALSNERGVIAALAIDQRKLLKLALEQARGHEITPAEIGEFKVMVAHALEPYTSAILMDTEYGLPALGDSRFQTGMLLAYEVNGYDTTIKGRLPDLLPEWSVRRLVEAGANGIKILLNYDPADDAEINTVKQAYIERIGAECVANDVPFFLEPISYSDAIGDEKGFEFARVKPEKVINSIREFSKPRYGVDILKVEVPVNMRFVEGSGANSDGQVAYSRAEALQYFKEAAAASGLPFIYLSAGVTDEIFRETLGLAAEAGAPFAGVLCGRATWQGGVGEYGRGGAAALANWLQNRGIQNIQLLNEVLATHARPWWDFYGGKENIEVI
jgi:tagatose 1,6-diphosphate aldolase